LNAGGGDAQRLAAAERAVARLEEMSADLRAAAVVDAESGVLAASGDTDWSAVGEMWAAADGLEGPRVTQVHVATAEGEVFATRAGAISVVALAPRHALAALMFCDLRSVLREVAG
jgi:hypothetical protein